ncbi:conserved hypothetical protein, membrane [mine drainage metagenome]|uniref:Uncharacterized protein n=2 Tax=mine drainage metagenome TaxID=410659 RepID=T0YF74_9ZZZZ
MTVVFGILGLAVTAMLVIHAGIRGILETLAVAGLSVLWLVPIHAIPIVLDSQGWKALLTENNHKVSSLFLFWVAGIREAMNGLLPVLRVGGELAGIRLAIQGGVTKSLAVASVLVEVTLTMLSQIIFALCGICLLVPVGHSQESIESIMMAILVAGVIVTAFIWVQHGRPFTFFKRFLKCAGMNERILRWFGEPLLFDHAIKRLYQDKSKLLKAMLWQMAGLVAGVAETWIALWLMGHQVGWGDALILESLSQATRSASFFVPSGIGVQEGSLVVFGGILGLQPDVSLALSLVKRLREVIFGLPFLISWQWFEHNRMYKKTQAIRQAASG